MVVFIALMVFGAVMWVVGSMIEEYATYRRAAVIAKRESIARRESSAEYIRREAAKRQFWVGRY